MRALKKASVLAVALATAGCQCTPEQPAQPQPQATEEPDPEAALAEGFYKAANNDAIFYALDGKTLKPIIKITPDMCVHVLNGQEGFEHAKVLLQDFEGLVKKADLVPAPECDTRTQKEPVGRVLVSRAAFIHSTPDNSANTLAQLTYGQCVEVLETRASQDWIRIAANTPRGRVEGWGFDMRIHAQRRCIP